MGDPLQDRLTAAMLPEGDVVGILLEQHARIKELFEAVRGASSDEKRDRFNELRALLAVHETAEQIVLRPNTAEKVNERIAKARTEEEIEATKALAELEHLDVDSPAFAASFADFEKAVSDHAEAEEVEEFPAIVADYTIEERQRMGKLLRATENIAPTHPHPSVAGHPLATIASLPVASIIDRARDALRNAS
ncbi:MAG: hemerythrin domain-containing protein [Aeromicrobium sp.]